MLSEETCLFTTIRRDLLECFSEIKGIALNFIFLIFFNSVFRRWSGQIPLVFSFMYHSTSGPLNRLVYPLSSVFNQFLTEHLPKMFQLPSLSASIFLEMQQPPLRRCVGENYQVSEARSINNHAAYLRDIAASVSDHRNKTNMEESELSSFCGWRVLPSICRRPNICEVQ